MKKFALAIGCLILAVSGAFAQNNSQMSLSTEEHGPGDRLTLFVTFKEPMPQLGNFYCIFRLSTPQNTQQSLFATALNCDASVQKDSDTQYRTFVQIPQSVATGEYALQGIAVTVASVQKAYQQSDLPALAPVKVRNPKDQPNFAPITDLKVK